MIHFLRRQALYVLSGFIVTFVIYLFITFDSEKVVKGLLISLIGGAGVAVLLFVLERWIPGRRARRVGSRDVDS